MPGARTRALLGVGLLALAVRVAVVALTPSYVPIHDDHSYVAHALVLLVTGHYPVVHMPHHIVQAAAYRPPGWPVALWVLWQLSGFGIGVARLLLAVLGALVAVLALLIGQRLFGPRAGLAAGMLAALCAPLIAVGASLEAETLFSVLVLGAVLAALTAHAHAKSGAATLALVAAAGALAGLAALTRTNGLVLVPVVAALAARGELRSVRTWLTGALALVAAVCVIAPWTLRNARDLHAFVPVSTEAGNTLAGTYDAAAARLGGRWIDPRRHGVDRAIFRANHSAPRLDAALTSASMRYVTRHPAYPAEVLLRNTGRYIGLAGPDWIRFSLFTMSLGGDDAAVLVWLGLALTVGLGLAGAALARGRGVPRALWAVPVLLWLSAALVNGELRLAAPVLPFLCIFGGVALARLPIGFRIRDQAPGTTSP